MRMPPRGPVPIQWRGTWQEEYAFQHQPRSRMSARARLIIPVVLSLVLQVPSVVFWAIRDPNPVAWVDAAALALALVGPLALLLRRKYPGPVVVFIAAAACVDFVLSTQHGPPFVALAFAIGSAVIHDARLWAWISVGASWTATVTIGLIFGIEWHPAQIALTTLGILIIFGLAEGLRTRREHYEEYRRAFAQRKQTEVQAERVRIARELHDVLAHSLSQINVQASVGLHLMGKQPDKAAEALASIKETSKTALDEVRSVLGVLRAEGGQDPNAPLVPEPDLARLPGLAASVTSQGVEVTLVNRVESAPKAVQLAIYRIVQESLTNVVRHAHASRATVIVRIEDGSYIVSIGDNGVGVDGKRPEGGRGVLGMQERAELLGGTLETSSAPEGGLLVTARIPVKDTE